jgi:hypothetical protein
MVHNGAHGRRHHLRDLSQEPEDDPAVAGSRHGDTPHKINSARPRLKRKLGGFGETASETR